MKLKSCMSAPSDHQPDREALREQLIGLGGKSLRKSYYPQLQQQIDELKKAKQALEEKSDSLMRTLQALDTARQRAETSEQRFRSLFEEIIDGVVVIDPDTGRFVAVNRAFCQMLQYSENELLQMAIPDLHPPEELDRARGMVRQLSGIPVQVNDLPFKRKDGSIFYADIHGTMIDFGSLRCVLGVCRDVTGRKQTEEELRQLNRLYSVLSHVNQALVHSVSHQELLERVCNAAIEFGAFKLVWVGKIDPATHRIFPVASAGDDTGFLDKVKVYADDRPEGRGTVGLSIREQRTRVSNDFLNFPGSRPWREEAATAGLRSIISLPLRNGGKMYGALVVYAKELNFFQSKEVALLEEVATDISFALDHLDQETRRQHDESALKKAKEEAEAANRTKDQFIAVLSHELRTPLTPVLSIVSLLQSSEGISEEIKSAMETIRRNIELEARLIDDLLDVTRISRGTIELHREKVDVHACLTKTVAFCRNEIAEKHLNVSSNFDAENFHVLADSARLQQVFWNLIKNAVKFTPQEGRISIRTKNTGNQLQIEIADTGIGIEPDLLPRIFTPFEQGEKTWTRRFGGLGIGLSIAKAVVELHHGRITAASEGSNKGAVFTIELGVLSTSPAGPRATPPTPPVEEAQRKILLVEDHSDTLRILSLLLRKWGYLVTGADCVADALQWVEQETFDLLISDIGLPDGSGLEIMREIRKSRSLPGIALSGFGTEEDREQSRDAGFKFHLTKPVGIEKLRSAIDSVLVIS